MSVRVDGYSVWCDGEDCMEWIGQQPTRREARASAKEEGWQRRKDGDFCPLHRTNKPPAVGFTDQGQRHWIEPSVADGIET